MAEAEPPFMKWVTPLDNIVFQAWYRVLSFVSIHAPVSEVYEAAKYIQKKRGGNIYWVIKERVARWEDLDVNPPHGVKMTVWLYGGKVRQKNTVLCRAGWYTLYLVDLPIKVVATILGGAD